jgi:hypothetical protein
VAMRASSERPMVLDLWRLVGWVASGEVRPIGMVGVCEPDGIVGVVDPEGGGARPLCLGLGAMTGKSGGGDSFCGVEFGWINRLNSTE